MGTAAIPDIPKGVCPPPSDIGTLGALYQPATAGLEKQQIVQAEFGQLVQADLSVILALVKVLDRQLLAAIAARSDAEFKAVRERVLPRYIRALRALVDTAINLVNEESLSAISDAMFGELAGDLEKQRARFGEKLADQGVFTLWTIRRVGSLGRELRAAGGVSATSKQTDIKLAHQYHITSLWAQFHLDLLFTAIKFDRPVCEEVRGIIIDGLRASVNAYVIMKEALRLRQPSREEEQAPTAALPWDEEDEELLAASMSDLDASCASE